MQMAMDIVMYSQMDRMVQVVVRTVTYLVVDMPTYFLVDVLD